MNNLYVAKKYEVEYSKAHNLLYPEEVNPIIRDNCESYWGNDDSSEYSDNIEVDKFEFKQLIEKLKMMSDDEFNKEYENFKGYNLNRDEIIKAFEDLLENAEPNDDTMHLFWF